ncbi:hypothetical protein RIF29_38709 [Crotalaria pallida]|uniref:Uncharacterized protein n=1 Tax=Crotalaria pallida TaxID=3830 RepID=A0AAN9E1P5_CROPI
MLRHLLAFTNKEIVDFNYFNLKDVQSAANALEAQNIDLIYDFRFHAYYLIDALDQSTQSKDKGVAKDLNLGDSRSTVEAAVDEVQNEDFTDGRTVVMKILGLIKVTS